LDKREEDLDVATTVACFCCTSGRKEVMFDICCVCFLESGFFSFVYLLLEKLVNEKYFPVKEKHFPVKEKIGLVFRKVFSFYFRRKTLSERCENLEMSYYLLIISNLVLKLLIAIYIYIYIYIVLNICFLISSLRI